MHIEVEVWRRRFGMFNDAVGALRFRFGILSFATLPGPAEVVCLNFGIEVWFATRWGVLLINLTQML